MATKKRGFENRSAALFVLEAQCHMQEYWLLADLSRKELVVHQAHAMNLPKRLQADQTSTGTEVALQPNSTLKKLR